MPKKHAALYVRVSTNSQDHRSQLPDLEQWAENQDLPIVWYKDKASGKTMDRPAWNELADAIRTGRVSTLVVWRLDRLGRTAAGLTKLFDELRHHKVNLVSIKDGLDLSTTAGRLMANMLAAVAEYEREVKAERQQAGIAKAKRDGKKWGGWTDKHKPKVTQDKIDAILHLHELEKPIAHIAKAVGLSRPTVYKVLNEHATA